MGAGAFEFAALALGIIIAGGLAAFVFSWLALKAVRQPQRTKLYRAPAPPKVEIEKAPTPPRVPFDELVHLEEVMLADPLPLEPPRHRPPLKRPEPTVDCRACGFVFSGPKLKSGMRCPLCKDYKTSLRPVANRWKRQAA